jgi:hypothetical protein
MPSYFRNLFKAASALLLSLLLIAGPTLAQVTTADVVGTVTDADGAILPGAKVTIENLSTHNTLSTQTNSAGDFVFTLLPSGNYSMRVEASGFKTYSLPSLILATGDRAREDVHMQVGAVTESVEVSATSPTVQTDSSVLSTTVTTQAVQDLPTNGRNFVQLAQLQPGANEGPMNGLTSGARPDDRRPTASVSVNGQSEILNNVMIDGMDNNERIISTIGVRPSIDAIAEFQVQTNDYTAEVSRSSGGVINIITKSGSNNFHGSAYEYFRNDVLDARNFFATTGPKPELRQNQFGGSFGGPIIKDKTFFFGDYEGFRQVQGITQTGSVPTLFEEQHPGNFSDVGGPVVTGLSPIALNYYKLFPAPNQGGPNQTANNFEGSQNRTQFSTTFDGRIDHHFNASDSLFGRYTYNNVSTFTPGVLPPTEVAGLLVSPGGNLGAFAGPAKDEAQNFMLSFTHIFNPNLLLNLKTSYTRINNNSAPLNLGSDASTKFGLPGVNLGPLTSGLSPMSVTGYSTVGDGFFVPILDIDNTFQYTGALTYNRGAHNISFGAALIRRQATNTQDNFGIGLFLYQNQATPQENMADFLQGKVDLELRQNELNAPHYRSWEPGFYIQDNWRATRWLTLNLGVRYDIFTPFTEAHNQISNFDPITGHIIVAGVGGVSDTAGIKTDYGNVAPRIGFAATVLPGMVIRGGYGISYFPSNYTSNASLKNQPFVSTFTGTNVLLSAGLPPPTAASATNPSGPIPDTVALNFQSSYLQEFNLTVEKEFANNVIRVGYVGMLGRHLPEILPDVNAPEPGSTVRPFAATIPNVTNIGGYITEGTSSYNALQASLIRRFSKGFTLDANYTFAHGIDDVVGLSNEGGDGYGVLPGQINTYERGNSDLDIRHRVAISGNYEIPFGKSLSGVEGGLLKDWQANAIFVWETGLPFTVRNSVDVSGNLTASNTPDRPNQIASGSVANPSTAEWFNVAAFETQAAGTVGQEARNTLFGPNFRHFDFSVFKTFPIKERFRLQFRAEIFNLTNTPSFAAPNSTLQPSGGLPGTQSGGFGTITATNANYTPREIQFALKLLF